MVSCYIPKDWPLLSSFLDNGAALYAKQQLFDQSQALPSLAINKLDIGLGMKLPLANPQASLLIAAQRVFSGNFVPMNDDIPIGHLLCDLIHTVENDPDLVFSENIEMRIFIPKSTMVELNAVECPSPYLEEISLFEINNVDIYTALKDLQQALRDHPEFGMDALPEFKNIHSGNSGESRYR